MKIDVLGSSSEGNAYVVSDGHTRLLIECGLPFKEIQVKSQFVLPDACLISHSHGDHAKCVDQLIRLGIPCCMSQQTFDEIGDNSLRSGAVFIAHQKSFRIGSFEIMPLEMSHDVYCLGFYIYSKSLHESLFFATDTCAIPYKLPSMDYIMVEANYDIEILNKRIVYGYIDPVVKKRLLQSHMEIGNTIKWLEMQDMKRTKRIYLLHLSHGSSNAGEFKRMVQEATGIPVTIA